MDNKISIVIPVYNEEENLKKLHKEILTICRNNNYNFEIVFVDDGSTDNSASILKEIARNDERAKVILFLHNFGQTAAMSAGIKEATGDIIIPMDADLQNDPADIPKFIHKIHEGFDVVSGWRRNRKDKMLTRRLPSQIANWLIGRITRVKIHDYGCSMKAYKKEIIQGIDLYGEMHRFIPAYAKERGAEITEIVVNHRPRIHGQTKYNLSRTFKVLLDLMVVKFLSGYMTKPIHFFGGIGFSSLFLGIAAGLAAIILRIFQIKYFVETPLPILSALLIIVGVQLVVMGILAEMLTRVYFESRNKPVYLIKEKINF